MLFRDPHPEPDDLRRAVRASYRADEAEVVARMLDAAQMPHDLLDRISERARRLVVEVRQQRLGHGGIDAFMHEFELSSREGVVLMCLAEALLRVPDAETVDKLIKDKIGGADWQAHLGKSDSLFVNASTWALMLTGRVVRLDDDDTRDLGGVLGRLVSRSGEPVIRRAVTQAMRILGRQFVMGRSIEEALDRAKEKQKLGYCYSFDMLGEAARTMEDAERYFESYRRAIAAIGKAGKGKGPKAGPGISVKLSALHPRYEFAKRRRVMEELLPRLVALAEDAKSHDMGFTVDAEEADRLDLSLDVIAAASADPRLAGWDGFGLAVQAYQKRAYDLCAWLIEMARRDRRRLMVRLVKGAYWDTEIKHSQELGLTGYPVFTRKASTDVAYLACMKRLLAAPEAIFPQFATHNAHTAAAVLELAGEGGQFEFQCLHGMGEVLYRQLVEAQGRTCRIYAPVGTHEDLLAYLVRRLLENGANTSFVNRIVDEKLPIDEIIADPIAKVQRLPTAPHPSIPLPVDLYGAARRNAAGIDLTDEAVLAPLDEAMTRAAEHGWQAGAIVGGRMLHGAAREVFSPADRGEKVGLVGEATAEHLEQALARARRAAFDWDRLAASAAPPASSVPPMPWRRARPSSWPFASRRPARPSTTPLAEVREAVDFCRYYAQRARQDFAGPKPLPGPTGERNELSLHGRGVFACISPWNFPFAIFTGQVTAALAAGNPVVAKPAEQTPLTAALAVRILHQAGIPEDVLHLLPGDGAAVGGRLVADPRVAGVAFTGSTETARLINRTLAGRDGPIVPLIAETGGQNAMIVDSTALPEQVVQDVITSSFQSAGQRCSALRVLFLQDDVADKMVHMLKGAMAELAVADPAYLSTDIGPVIDEEARQMLVGHAERMRREAKLLAETPLAAECAAGTFFAPMAFEIDGLARLQGEVFGPILHVIRYDAGRLDQVIDAINGTGYGLTFGVHTRIDSMVEHVRRRLRVGNAYVNRNQIGAIVGVQPFGGEGLSGTGPKAGGPHYLYRFATERTISIDTTAAGGNASLMSLEELPV